MQNASLPPLDIDPPLLSHNLDKLCEIVSHTYDNISSTYTQKHFDDFVLDQSLEAFVRHLKRLNKQHASVLDIGCGPGSEAKFLLARGFHVVGIDASLKMIETANRFVPAGTFHEMKIHDLHFPEKQFDAIWSARTLIHVPKTLVVDLLATWKRVLKPDGLLGISVILGELNGWGPEEYAPELFMFNHYFAEHELDEALESAGYVIVDRQIIEDSRDSDSPQNLFVFAQKSDARLDLTQYVHHIHLIKQAGERWTVDQECLEDFIATHLQAGVLTTREQVNLCVLYDRLAKRDRADESKYKLAAQKLKLHLQMSSTLSSQDFEVWFTLGQLHLKLTQFERAVHCLERARSLRNEDFDTLVRLGYSYEGWGKFDTAIAVAHEAEELAKTGRCSVDDEKRADLYHALGHFYVSRSHMGHAEMSASDRENGEHYMEKACNTGKKGFSYLSCLGSIYNETKRYPETIRLLDEAMNKEKVLEYEDLHSELYFYHGEACMGVDRYDEAMRDFDRVEQYAYAKQDWDALAHVKLYQVRTHLKGKSVSELGLDEILKYLKDLYSHEPSPYVVESFQQDRERLINILRAFYLLKQCLDEHNLSDDFNRRLAIAIACVEKMYERDHKPELGLLVLADDPGAAKGYIWNFNVLPYLYGFDEIETDLTERVREDYMVWGVLVLKEQVEASSLAAIAFLLGRFYSQGYTIYVYDPHNVFPESIRRPFEKFFVKSIEELNRFCYVILLHDKVREYLSSTRTPLGMAPIGVAPSLLASQAEDIYLLPIEGVCME